MSDFLSREGESKKLWFYYRINVKSVLMGWLFVFKSYYDIFADADSFHKVVWKSVLKSRKVVWKSVMILLKVVPKSVWVLSLAITMSVVKVRFSRSLFIWRFC